MFDRRCPKCEAVKLDCYEPVTAPKVQCEKCGAETERAWLSKPANVIGDDIPGGMLIEHGLCNADGSARRYYSKSEIAREAAKRGLSNQVRHVPANRGTDKSPHTKRWY